MPKVVTTHKLSVPHLDVDVVVACEYPDVVLNLLHEVNEIVEKAALEAGAHAVAISHEESVLLRTQGKLAAVKAHRERTGSTLSESARVINDYCAATGFKPPTSVPPRRNEGEP